MPRTTRDPKPRLWDRELEDPELEQIIEEYMDSREAAKSAVAAAAALKAKLKALADGDRIRCGEFVITGKARNGGGFEVPAWQSVAGRVERV